VGGGVWTEIYLCHAWSRRELLRTGGVWTEIYLCHAWSPRELLRTETARQAAVEEQSRCHVREEEEQEEKLHRQVSQNG
jgi:hypothetical protein